MTITITKPEYADDIAEQPLADTQFNSDVKEVK